MQPTICSGRSAATAARKRAPADGLMPMTIQQAATVCRAAPASARLRALTRPGRGRRVPPFLVPGSLARPRTHVRWSVTLDGGHDGHADLGRGDGADPRGALQGADPDQTRLR